MTLGFALVDVALLDARGLVCAGVAPVTRAPVAIEPDLVGVAAAITPVAIEPDLLGVAAAIAPVRIGPVPVWAVGPDPGDAAGLVEPVGPVAAMGATGVRRVVAANVLPVVDADDAAPGGAETSDEPEIFVAGVADGAVIEADTEGPAFIAPDVLPAGADIPIRVEPSVPAEPALGFAAVGIPPLVDDRASDETAPVPADGDSGFVIAGVAPVTPPVLAPALETVATTARDVVVRGTVGVERSGSGVGDVDCFTSFAS